MGIKVNFDERKLLSRIRERSKRRHRAIDYDRIGQYLVDKIRTEGRDMIDSVIENDYVHLNRDSLLEASTSQELLDKVTYRIRRDWMGNPILDIGIFDDAEAVKSIKSIEYGTTKTPEIPIFRTIIPEHERDVVRFMTKRGYLR